ncbi:MAG: DUF4397 domain-containing protein [Polyangiaceae bacterium]|nr:DUF4397 domain-containing protein [Polyangiaceae bacterium]
MRSLSIAWVLGACLVAGSVSGCDSESQTDDGTGAGGSGEGGEGAGGSIEPQDGKAMIRIVHASADAPAVDIWVKGGASPIASALAYGDASAWLEVDPGTYDVEIKASPSTAADPAVYSTGGIELAEGDKVSAVAAGLLASTADSTKFRVLPIREEFSPAGSGNAILRVVHASADAPTVAIDLHDDDPSAPEITNIDRFTSTPEAGFPLTAGAALQIGIDAGGSRVTAFTTPALPEGAEILVIATGLVAEPANESDGFALLAIGPEGALGFVRQNPVVYALHASPNAPSVDLYAGSAALAKGLSFGNLAGPVRVPPATYTIDFRAAGSSADSPPAVSASTGALEAGNQYLTVATGLLGGAGEQAFRLVSMADAFDRSKPESALVRVAHASPDAPMVDLGILNVEGVVNPVVVSDLSFGSSSDGAGLDIGLGTIPLGVTPANANDAVVASFHVTTAAGIRAFAIAAGALSPENGESFRLLAVDTSTNPWSVATIHPQPQ